MKQITIATLWAGILLTYVIAVAEPSQPETQKVIAPESTQTKYPEFSWDYIPRYMHVFKRDAYTEEEIEFLAKYPLITFEKAQGVATGSVQAGTLQAAKAVKKLNPKAKILYYKNIVIDWPGSAMSKELTKIEGGYLKSTDGTSPVVNDYSGAKFFDISLPAVQNLWMEDASMMLSDPFIDGIFIDANIKVLETAYFARGKKVGEAKSQELVGGYHSILDRVNAELRPDSLVIANLIRARFEDGGLQYINRFDGSYLESFEHAVGGVSKVDYIAQGIAHTQKAARRGKIIAFTVGLGAEESEDSSGIGLDENRKDVDDLDSITERLNYITAIFLVMAEEYSYFLPFDQYLVRPKRGEKTNRTWLRTLPVFKKKLGPPKGPATQKGYIYTREFANCSVWLDIEKEKAKLTWR